MIRWVSATAIVTWDGTWPGRGINAAIASMLAETRREIMELIDSLWSNSTLLRDGALNKLTTLRCMQPLSRRSFNCGRWISPGAFISKYPPVSEEEMVRRRTLLKLAM